MTGCRTQVTFGFLPRKQVIADFSGGAITSDAGLLLLPELDQRLGWTARMAGVLEEVREVGKVRRDKRATPGVGWTNRKSNRGPTVGW